MSLNNVTAHETATDSANRKCLTRNRVVGSLIATALGVSLFAPSASAAAPGSAFQAASAGNNVLVNAAPVAAPATYTPATVHNPAAGNGKLEITATTDTFEASLADFRAAKWTAVVNSRTIPVTWVSATKVTVALPAGEAGTAATITFKKDGVDTGEAEIKYEGKITSVMWKLDGADGSRIGTIRGVGLDKITGLKLATTVAGDASAQELTLTSRADLAALTAAAEGYTKTATEVRVKLPANVTGQEGAWRLATTYTTGFQLAAISPATKLDTKFVAPKLTRLSAAAFNTATTSDVTVYGTNLGAVAEAATTTPASYGVFLRPVAAVDASTDIKATIKSSKQTQIVIATPVTSVPSPIATGAYRVVLKSGLGETVASSKPTERIEAVASADVTGLANIGGNGGGARLTVAGSILGADVKTFNSLRFSAKSKVTVNGKDSFKTIALKYIDKDTVEAAIPTGTPGETVPITVYRNGVEIDSFNLKYDAAITGLTKNVLTTAGGDVKINGVGLSGTFTLKNIAKADGSALSADAALAADKVKLDTKGKSGTLTIPALAEGVYQITFAPASPFAGANQVFTSKSVLTVSNNG
ncbi:hypothetical protein [Kineosporia babensis]|uniref:Uncharacterized protein n=1 Tax=Kineosporia babensis TaxID=499548 RepID=A0A9X1N8Z8_9ACTN|nr:hypothetical protein [Kineosporia babensis]MCD5309773.1 hypothetical protein [Kineosporia babensis]